MQHKKVKSHLALSCSSNIAAYWAMKYCLNIFMSGVVLWNELFMSLRSVLVYGAEIGNHFHECEETVPGGRMWVRSERTV
jgi:hypothetical protein